MTVTVARNGAPGWEAEFLKWADEWSPRCASSPVASAPRSCIPVRGGEYQIIVRFSDGVMLRVWERSPLRNELDGSQRQVRHGHADATHGRRRGVVRRRRQRRAEAPLWKKLSFDVAWVYPAALFISVVAAPLLVKIPLGIRVLTSIAVVTVVMQFIVMPIRKRLRAKRRF